MRLAAWQVEANTLRKVGHGSIGHERDFETWLADDPALIDDGLAVIAQQLHVDAGRLDLLCVDLQGRCTVVEVKRGRLLRETVAQALDYAGCIAQLPTADLVAAARAYIGGRESEHPGVRSLLATQDEALPREVQIVVVGLDSEPGLERLVTYLGTTYGVPIRAINFEVFDLADGSKVLVREAKESATPARAPESAAEQRTLERVIAVAGGPESPEGKSLLAIAAAAERNGLHVRPYKVSLMITPPSMRTRMLFVVWKDERRAGTGITFSPEAIAEFFPIAPERVVEILGPELERVRLATEADADAVAAKIDQLFAEIRRTTED